MRPSWIPVFVLLIAAGYGVFALFPTHWSPAPGQGILAGMVMYFVAFTRVTPRTPSELGHLPPLFGPGGLAPVILFRAAAFLVILVGMAYVYFERRSFFDVTWPVLILASWNLAEGMLRSRRRERV